MQKDKNVNILPNGPFNVELKIALTNGKDVAEVKYGMTPGKYPAPEDIRAALDKAVAQVREQMKDDSWRLLNKQEYFRQLVPGALGFPGPQEFEE